jgi:hypothetical protein
VRQISYNVPLDGTTTLCQPPFTALGIVISNQTNQAVTVTDGRATTWTCPAGAAIKRQGREADSFTARLAASATGDGCAVTFTADPVDDEGPAAIVGTQPTETALLVQASRAGGIYGDTITLPSDIRAILVVNLGSQITEFRVTGTQSGYVYLDCNPSAVIDPHQNSLSALHPVVPVLRSLDSTLGVVMVSGGIANNYAVYGLRRDPTPGTWDLGGALLVRGPDSGLVVSGPLTDAQLAARLPFPLSGVGSDLSDISGSRSQVFQNFVDFSIAIKLFRDLFDKTSAF